MGCDPHTDLAAVLACDVATRPVAELVAMLAPLVASAGGVGWRSFSSPSALFPVYRR